LSLLTKAYIASSERSAISCFYARVAELAARSVTGSAKGRGCSPKMTVILPLYSFVVIVSKAQIPKQVRDDNERDD